jgi:hypothetical protein
MQGSDNRSLLPMAEAAHQALGQPAQLNVVADAGFSNGAQAETCETRGILPQAPANRATNNQADGNLFDRTVFRYDETTDTFRCPAAQALVRRGLRRKDHLVSYAAPRAACGNCKLKPQCTTAPRRQVTRHLHEAALKRMQQRATPEIMRLRKSTVEHPFATLKYRIFGHPRFLLRGLAGVRTEISLATIAYNLKRMTNILGVQQLSVALKAY